MDGFGELQDLVGQLQQLLVLLLFLLDGLPLVVGQDLRSALAGQRAVYPWSLVAAAWAALNVAHAPEHLASQAVAGIPPVALLLAVELLMRGARLYLGVQGVDTTRESDTARPGNGCGPG